MVGSRLGEKLGMSEEVMIKACSVAMKAHKSSGKQQYTKAVGGGSGGGGGDASDDIIFGFAGSWSPQDFYAHEPFGEMEIDRAVFPSLRSIGNNELATVNQGFMRRFQTILQTPSFHNEVETAVNKGKNVVFTGHSSGGPVAILITLWFLEKYKRVDGNHVGPRCVTFGSPLVGDWIFTHALNRENWARHFIHFVGRYDIVPRVMLTPLSSIQRELGSILSSLNPKSPQFQQEALQCSNIAIEFFTSVMRNAASVANHAACNLMGSTNSIMETISGFVKLSPYRPSGTYIFCTGNGKLVFMENHHAVLQTLFYSTQPSSPATLAEDAYRSLRTVYEGELHDSLQMQDVVYLDDLNNIPLSSNGIISSEMATINRALNDLGLSATARMPLRAAEEFENRKKRNQASIESNKNRIVKALSKIDDYRKSSRDRRLGYYDAFKIQKDNSDFDANVNRLELAGIWDEIIEMLKRYELPDSFEGIKEWIDMGTRFRRLVEPLDIANYYRHSKNEDTGTYLREGGRPKRYKYTQRWREHADMMQEGASSETIFWARVEEMRRKSFDDIKEEILVLEAEALESIQRKELETDVFLDKSTFVEWWRTLPEQHRSGSCLKGYMNSFLN